MPKSTNKKEDKKVEKKGKFTNMIKDKKIIMIATALLLVIIGVIAFVLIKLSNNPTVISINGTKYNKSDYMIYLRLAKTNLFNENTTDLPEATLNTIADKTTNTTVENYLRGKVEESIKVAGAIETMAEENNISLNEEQSKKLEADKKKYVSNLGGQKKFNEFLKKNRTTEKAYDKMARVDTLYKEVFNSLYAEGKKYDLTEDEKKQIEKDYYQNYNKIKQIVLYTVDTSTKEPLSNSVVEQKKLLAKTLRSMITDVNDFDSYIKKYSDDAINVEPPYDMYFTSNQVLKEIQDTVSTLKDGEISNVFKSTYAYHIVFKEKLDDGYLETLYNSKREEKFLKAISDKIDDSVIIMENEFTKVKIK